ncbi:MAG: hypothetical protein HYV07_02390 [Deltaproteobacteria bacterium]|nr:hypothetical protein [Deltaproteobacteria bacterium]
MNKPILAVLLLITACQLESPPEPPLAQSAAGALMAAHEWGTFTSVMGSDGKSLEGLQHTEELLPSFVHMRDATAGPTKGAGGLAAPVHQKLETPVIYFYGVDGVSVSVDVSFPKGVISEWYPEAATFAPELGAPLLLTGGRMRWELELVDTAVVPEVAEDSVWAPSRRVAARGVRVRQGQAIEDEGFVFYRGLGCFEVPISVTSKGDEITISNASSDDLAGVVVLLGGEEEGGVISLGTLEANGSRTIARAEIPLYAAEHYIRDAKATLAQSLETSGLYPDEARAMVDTWTRSYFVGAGLRVLYVVPRVWTDELLPIEISPNPAELVRTLVGRIEVMTETEEQDVIADLAAAKAAGRFVSPTLYGRFTEPKLRRAAELITDPTLKEFASIMAIQAATAP